MPRFVCTTPHKAAATHGRVRPLSRPARSGRASGRACRSAQHHITPAAVTIHTSGSHHSHQQEAGISSKQWSSHHQGWSVMGWLGCALNGNRCCQHSKCATSIPSVLSASAQTYMGHLPRHAHRNHTYTLEHGRSTGCRGEALTTLRPLGEPTLLLGVNTSAACSVHLECCQGARAARVWNVANALYRRGLLSRGRPPTTTTTPTTTPTTTTTTPTTSPPPPTSNRQRTHLWVHLQHDTLGHTAVVVERPELLQAIQAAVLKVLWANDAGSGVGGAEATIVCLAARHLRHDSDRHRGTHNSLLFLASLLPWLLLLVRCWMGYSRVYGQRQR